MKKSHTYKFAFFALVGIFLMFGIAKCTAQIPQDKWMHGAIGGVSSAWFSTLSMPQNEILKPAIYGITGAAILGTSKELLDLAGLGTPEWADLGATMLGAVVIQGIIIVIKAIIIHFKTPKYFNYARQ